MPAAAVGAVTGGIGLWSAKKASDAQQDSTNAAINQQNYALDRMIELTGPQRQLGYGATNELSRLFGYGGPQNQQMQQGPGGGGMRDAYRGAGGNFGNLINRAMNRGGMDTQAMRYGGPQQQMMQGPQGPQGMQNFIESPDYEFRRSQGLQGIAQTLGAGGQGAFSGNALRGMNEYNSNLASGEFSNYINRRLAMAGLGQTANMNAQSAYGQNAANVGGMMMDAGNARASGIMGAGSIVGGTINSLFDAYTNRGGLNNTSFSNIFNDPGMF